MDLSINTNINIFKNNIINVVGNSKLPVGITYYVLKDILLEIQDLYDATLKKEEQEILNTNLAIEKDKKTNSSEEEVLENQEN